MFIARCNAFWQSGSVSRTRGEFLDGHPFNRAAGALFGLFAFSVVAACTPVSNPGAGPGAGVGGPDAASGETLGTGSVRVALLVSRSATGNAGTAALAYRNAAELALKDFPNADIQLVVYDTGGKPETAQAAADRAVSEGAELILGPLFSSEVRAVAPVARKAGVPVVAFSSDIAVAGSGVYLLSFPPAGNINTIVDFAASKGQRSYAALVPNDAYGAVVEAAFRQRVGATGGRVVAIERYQLDQIDIQTKATEISKLRGQIDTLLIPGNGDEVPLITGILSTSGMTGGNIMFLGSGQWDDGRIHNDKALAGSYYPAPDRKGFDAFAQRYQAAYGAAPPRRVSLAYDGVVLAAGLVRQFGPERFSQKVLTNPNGFAGIDGVFRFLTNGSNQRRLNIFEVTGSGVRVERPAPRSFTGSGT
jgi:ABC-type branched-subunit amino acid transport system substrate-binding protein